MSKVTADQMRRLQTDNFSLAAKNVLPVMLTSVNKSNLTASEREAFNIIAKWNYIYDAGEIAVFEIWQNDLHTKIWDEFNECDAPMRLPNRDRTVHLLLDEPNSKWFDITRTPAKESRNMLVLSSFKFAIDSLQRKFGLIGKKWQWGNVKGSHVPHLAKIAGFGSKTLFTGGSKTAVNALAESNGPSWRMVIALGKKPKGFGVFPGGESGNPGSFYYDDMVDTWSKGQLNELLFLNSKSEQNLRITNRLILKKK
jgi:penicillin amidase